MFKKSILALSIIALSGAALSAPIANLKVTGTITPPTCTVNGVDEADVLYTFDVAPGLFPATGNLTLDEQVKNIEVVCDATTYLAFDATDNRVGTELTTGNTNFGLGTYDTDTKVGFYTVTIKNATVKADADANPIPTAVKVGASTAATQGIVNKTDKVLWTTGNAAVSGQIFAADFAVKPTLNAALKNSDGTAKLDGHTILTFSFGV